MGVNIDEPYWRCWGRRLRWWRWRPVLAGLILRRSLQRDPPHVPTPSHFNEPGLRYQSRRLYWRRWRPTMASLMRLKLGGPGLKCPGCRLRLWKRRPTMACLVLNQSQWRDLSTILAPSLMLDEWRWGRQMDPPVVLLLMADVLPLWPCPRLVRDHLRLYAPSGCAA